MIFQKISEFSKKIRNFQKKIENLDFFRKKNRFFSIFEMVFNGCHFFGVAAEGGTIDAYV